MKYQIVFLVSLACVLLAVEAKPTQTCEPGSVFMQDCNTCKCNTDGTDMACTRKNCSGGEDGSDPATETEHKEGEHKEGEHKEGEHKEGEHKEGEHKEEEHKEGEHKEEEHKEQKDDSVHCVPGELFKKDCNDCTCPPSGLKSGGACTLLACLDDDIAKE